MRSQILLLVVSLLGAVPAHASCDVEVKRIVWDFWKKGPFHFEMHEWRGGTASRTIGKVIPGMAEHVLATGHERPAHRELVQIGNRRWEKDDRGWRQPVSAYGFQSFGIPEFPFLAETVCEGTIDLPEGKYRTYTYKPDPSSRVTIHVDPVTGSISRMATSDVTDGADRSVTTFRYDSAIRIDPPMVDPKARRKVALRRFEQEVAETDPQCRAEVIDILVAGASALPFEFQRFGGMPTGVSGIQGRFVPPDAVSLVFEDNPGFGGNSESIFIGETAWHRPAGGQWSTSASVGVATRFLEDLLPLLTDRGPFHVGAALCTRVGGSGPSGRQYYSYALYRDGADGRELVRRTAMTIDHETGLPARFDRFWADGTVTVQIRNYAPALTIESPLADID